MLNFQSMDVEPKVWEAIWKSQLHQRLKLFLWRFAANAFPTNEILNQRITRISVKCVVCGKKGGKQLPFV